jgi:Uma2 family endonuclease
MGTMINPHHNGRPRTGDTPMATQPDEQPVWTIPADLRLRLLAALSAPDRPPKLTYEEFLEWADEDTYAEWVDGEVIMPSPANTRHQSIVTFLSTVLTMFVGKYDLGQIFTGPFHMKLAHSGREPDVMFVTKEHLSRLTETYLNGPADMVVEVISPESIGRDRGVKFFEYEGAGIPEYWLIDPLTQRAEFYQLDAAGRYQLIPPGSDDIYHSKVLPGLWLRLDWLWQDPLPTPNSALREIGVIA